MKVCVCQNPDIAEFHLSITPIVNGECGICKGTGLDKRQWYVLVGWSTNCKNGYWKMTSNIDMIPEFFNEGMELYGIADSIEGANELSNKFYDNGGWFYR